jgi:hypothetical protein
MIYHSPELMTVKQNQFIPSGQAQYFQFGEDIIGTATKAVAASNSCLYEVGIVLDMTFILSIEDGHGTIQFISHNFDAGQSNVIPITAEEDGDHINISFGSGEDFIGSFGPCDIEGTITGEMVIDTSVDPATMDGGFNINITNSSSGQCSLPGNGLPCNLALDVD